MTAPTTVPPAKTTSPRLVPTVLSAVGSIVGVLVVLAGHHGDPGSTAQAASTVSGALATATSVGFGILAHLGISKAELEHDAALMKQEWPQVQTLIGQAETDFPGLAGRVDAIEQGLEARIDGAVSSALKAVDMPSEDAIVQKAITRIFGALQLSQELGAAPSVQAVAPAVGGPATSP